MSQLPRVVLTSAFQRLLAGGKAKGVVTWDPKDCTQCKNCVDVCPQECLKAFVVPLAKKDGAPAGFKSAVNKDDASSLFVIAPGPSCNGCGECTDACESSSLKVQKAPEFRTTANAIFQHLSGGAAPAAEGAAPADCAVKYTPGDRSQENLIVSIKQLVPKIHEIVVHNPDIATRCEAGNFVVVRANEEGERVPLTIGDFDREKKTFTMVIQEVGSSSRQICNLKQGDKLKDILGPLGRPTEIEKFGTCVVVAGGVGVAPVHPIARALKEAGNHVIGIHGARNKEMVFWEKELQEACSEVILTTDDGSYKNKGVVTVPLQKLIDSGRKIDHVWAIGPGPMMGAVAELTRKYKIPTTVSINAIMVDGTGMCGGCRVTVDGKTKFTCVDGPEFDAHKVNLKELVMRLRQFKPDETAAAGSYDAFSKRIGEAAPDRVDMPEQDPKVRAHNFDEVALGYTEELAIREAKRCLQCKKPTCVNGCPVNIPIPQFIKKITEGKFLEAYEIIKGTNSLPAVTGRVCPQEVQCERKCVLNKEGSDQKPIAIGRLERFSADYARKHGYEDKPLIKKNGKKVAVIGAGPAGLTAAGDLAKKGYDVTVFEALHKLGGVLAYGIPEFRLPKAIVAYECKGLESLGVKFTLNKPVGPAIPVQQLLKEDGYNAIFMGLGAGLPYFLGIPGENLNGVSSSNEFLTRINLMKAYKFPEYSTPVKRGKNVAVCGGGNVAMDSARSALRLGAENVYLVYRRSKKEIPARAEELHHALEEGVKLLELTNPLEVLGDKDGWVRGLKVQQMELGAPDKSGRRSPVPIPGSEREIPVDQLIVAIGNGSNPLLTRTFPELKLNKRGNIVADKEGRTSVKGVFAGGDIVTGAATVIKAMGAGKVAAQALDDYLMKGVWSN